MRRFILLSIFAVTAASANDSPMVKSWHALQKIHRVFVSPRCTNCHSPTSRPLQGDEQRLHSMLVRVENNLLGQQCSSCHRDSNSPIKNGPPGGLHWAKPSILKTLHAKMTPQDLCRLLRNPAASVFESGENIGKERSLADILQHLQIDPLVRWAWNPGPGRTPAPGTHAEFLEAAKSWIENGAYCP